MNLLLRINLALGAAFVLIAVPAGLLYRSSLQANAQRRLLNRAGLMMDSAEAMRAYTANEIAPLLAAQMKSEFLPQSVPFYAATQNFLKLREKYPQYAYKEATLNPTNPRDRAADWEADIIQRFRNDAAVRELSGVRSTPMGESLYLAQPIKAQAECLSCHSLPAAAPRTLIARYGVDNGFGWHAGEVVGAQVVSVPIGSAAAGVRRQFAAFLAGSAGVVALLWLAVNGALYYLVVRPLRRIARIADTLSVGEPCAEEFPESGAGELTALGRSFERMRKSLDKAIAMLEA
ncbi:MAG TPA: DUF3365 domain-containing protein [Steroidobacteraceae bacterium]|nr:DUF3365 domain-containing protein [Steroidobacteraceae bacterium]